MNELNRRKGERRKVHVNLTTTFFSYIPEEKETEGLYHRHQLNINQLKKAPCPVITFDYYTISLHTMHTGTILESMMQQGRVFTVHS
jgi:hypothetical protein